MRWMRGQTEWYNSIFSAGLIELRCKVRWLPWLSRIRRRYFPFIRVVVAGINSLWSHRRLISSEYLNQLWECSLWRCSVSVVSHCTLYIALWRWSDTVHFYLTKSSGQSWRSLWGKKGLLEACWWLWEQMPSAAVYTFTHNDLLYQHYGWKWPPHGLLRARTSKH